MLPVLFLVQRAAIPALADYHVQPGDVLEISVSGSPELHRHIMINNYGKIYFPLLGEVDVAGLPLSQLRQKFHDLLVAKHAFDNPDVTVDIEKYRPIYVSGDVAKPGAYSYLPGMTVRDAIALAGGYGRNGSAFPGSFDARDQYETLSIEFGRLQILIARLRAELAGGTEIDLAGLQTDGAMSPILSEFVNMETQQLKTDQGDYNNEKTHLTQLIKETQDQISAFVAEQAQQQFALAQQQKDAARVQGLFQRSLVQIGRVEEEQRAMSSTATAFFETKARADQARRDLETYTMQLQKLADRRKVEILQQLERATSELAAAKVHLATASKRMGYIAADMPRGSQEGNGVPDLVIFRGAHGDQQRIAANEDMDMLPGDALEAIGGAASGSSALMSGIGLPDLAARAPIQRQSYSGNQPEPVAHATLPLARIATVGESDAILLPTDPPAPPAKVERGVSDGTTASAALPKTKPPAPRNRDRDAAPSPPLGAGAARTTPPVVAPGTKDRSAWKQLRKAGDAKVLEGDLASGRLFYERAADAGDARAALDLGNSFNPAFLERLGVLGMRGDAVMAARWYQRARMLGDPEAEKALQTLPRQSEFPVGDRSLRPQKRSRRVSSRESRKQAAEISRLLLLRE